MAFIAYQTSPVEGTTNQHRITRVSQTVLSADTGETAYATAVADTVEAGDFFNSSTNAVNSTLPQSQAQQRREELEGLLRESLAQWPRTAAAHFTEAAGLARNFYAQVVQAWKTDANLTNQARFDLLKDAAQEEPRTLLRAIAAQSSAWTPYLQAEAANENTFVTNNNGAPAPQSSVTGLNKPSDEPVEDYS